MAAKNGVAGGTKTLIKLGTVSSWQYVNELVIINNPPAALFTP
jgi:hypothetical protein